MSLLKSKEPRLELPIQLTACALLTGFNAQGALFLRILEVKTPLGSPQNTKNHLEHAAAQRFFRDHQPLKRSINMGSYGIFKDLGEIKCTAPGLTEVEVFREREVRSDCDFAGEWRRCYCEDILLGEREKHRFYLRAPGIGGG